MASITSRPYHDDRDYAQSSLKRHQRRGLATAVMEKEYGFLGAMHVLVSTRECNAPANALYTSLGFQVVDRN